MKWVIRCLFHLDVACGILQIHFFDHLAEGLPQVPALILQNASNVRILPMPIYSKVMAASAQDDLDHFPTLTRTTIFGISFVSAIYFADILFKAKNKCFWFDELYTFYLCRLPTFKDTWAAVTHGVDFNPPLFYLFTRAAQRIFGQGLIATRLPSIIGVWIFCLCLYFFMARRAGAISGFIAAVFPLFTLAQYYAYEARAHGISLGWCGLALVCWQRNAERRQNSLWLAGFALSLLGALLTHVYSVYLVIPFAVVEVYALVESRRANWGVVAVMISAVGSVAWFVYLPLIRLYQGAAIPVTTFFPVSHDLMQRFIINAIGPATPVLLLWIILSAVDGAGSERHLPATMRVPKREILVAAGFVCIPFLGLIGCKLSHGPFIERYFLSSIAGVAILLGFATHRWQTGWTTKVFAGSLLIFMVADLVSTLYLGSKHRIVLIEPSSDLRLSTVPERPMMLYETLSKRDQGLDVLVIPSLDYLYFMKYAPPSTVAHLFFGAAPDDWFLSYYKKLAMATGLDIKTTTFEPFLATHDRFLVYEHGAGSGNAQEAIARAGFRLRWAGSDANGTMDEYSK